MVVKLIANHRHIATVGLPIVGLIAAFLIAYPQYKTLKADEASVAQTKLEIASRAAQLAVLKASPNETVVARVPSTPDEPVEFLRNLNTVAQSCGVKIVNYTAAPPVPTALAVPVAPTEAGHTNGFGDPIVLPEGTTANTLVITAEGNYAAVARFFEKLETYPRLINVSQVQMKTKKYPVLTTEFRLSRYIGQPPVPAAAA